MNDTVYDDVFYQCVESFKQRVFSEPNFHEACLICIDRIRLEDEYSLLYSEANDVDLMNLHSNLSSAFCMLLGEILSMSCDLSSSKFSCFSDSVWSEVVCND